MSSVVRPRFEVVEAKRYKHVSGRIASIYGALPWTSPSEATQWTMESVGWTIRDNADNTVGLGRVPFATESEALAHAGKLNDDHEANQRAWEARYPFRLNRLGYATLHEALTAADHQRVSGTLYLPDGSTIELKRGKRRDATGRKWIPCIA